MIVKMKDAEVLILNGAPGSGKSTLAGAIAERLREMDVAHAVIDVDAVGHIYPELGTSFDWKNVRVMWPNYTAVANLKVILPVCINDKNDLEELRNATPCGKFTICELVADTQTLKDRVATREPNQYWQEKLRRLVDKYIDKSRR
ncbi:MAG: AAA family ATPase [Candidatus Binataceae bacterium]